MKIAFVGKTVLAGILGVAIAGCASIMHGTSQKVGISSSPTGAIVSVDNEKLGATPLFADLKRGTEHIITIEMPGYEKTQLTVTKSVSGWVWGNLLFGGIIGLAVDFGTGGLYELSPAQLQSEMKKSDAKVSKNDNGIIVVAVLQPNADWKKIGSLQPQL